MSAPEVSRRTAAAGLLALVQELEASDPAVRALEDARDALPPADPQAFALDEQVLALVERRWELRGAIADTPAKTPDELAAKARAALWELSDGDPEAGPTHGCSNVAWSLARDVLGRSS